MRKIIAAMNMTLDGNFDHNEGVAGDEIHAHYADLLDNSDVMLLGRITYQLMEFWPEFLRNPTDNKAMNDFAVSIDRIPKIVFSKTLKDIEWPTARLATRELKDEVGALKNQPGKDILISSRSLIVALLNLGMIDELQIIIHPTITGKGPRLLDNINEKINLKLISSKVFETTGSVLLCYEPGS